MLVVVDHYDRSRPVLYADHFIGAKKVITTLEGAARKSDSLPQAITVDDGPEFTGKTLDAWAYVNGIQIDFTRPGKPTDKMDISNRSTASCTMNSSRPPHP